MYPVLYIRIYYYGQNSLHRGGGLAMKGGKFALALVLGLLPRLTVGILGLGFKVFGSCVCVCVCFFFV